LWQTPGFAFVVLAIATTDLQFSR